MDLHHLVEAVSHSIHFRRFLQDVYGRFLPPIELASHPMNNEEKSRHWPLRLRFEEMVGPSVPVLR
jgi:hypothetical protein